MWPTCRHCYSKVGDVAPAVDEVHCLSIQDMSKLRKESRLRRSRLLHVSYYTTASTNYNKRLTTMRITVQRLYCSTTTAVLLPLLSSHCCCHHQPQSINLVENGGLWRGPEPSSTLIGLAASALGTPALLPWCWPDAEV